MSSARALVLNAPRDLGFETIEDRPVGPAEVRIRTLFSGISAGTLVTALGSGKYG